MMRYVAIHTTNVVTRLFWGGRREIHIRGENGGACLREHKYTLHFPTPAIARRILATHSYFGVTIANCKKKGGGR